MAKKSKKFKNEAEERKYWEDADSSEHFDLSQVKKVRLSKLKPSTQTISLRLPKDLLEEIKIMANKRDVPYQSLIKVILRDRIEDEFAA